MEIATTKQRFIGKDPRKDSLFLADDDGAMFPTYQLNVDPYLPESKGASILDLGSGYGTFLRYLAQKGYHSSTGVDPDARCVEFCKNKGLNVQYAEDPLEYLRSRRQSFDFVAAFNVLNYFERERLLDWFTALHDCLKPGGVLVIDVANAASWTGRTDYIQDPFMKSEYTDVALEQYLLGTGLSVVQLGELRLPRKGWRRTVWLSLQKVWFKLLKFIYVLERGRCERNPRLFSKRIFLVAKRQGDLH